MESTALARFDCESLHGRPIYRSYMFMKRTTQNKLYNCNNSVTASEFGFLKCPLFLGYDKLRDSLIFMFGFIYYLSDRD